MDERMMKKLIYIVVLFFAFQANAQFIIGGNIAYQIPFGAEKNFFGAQLLLEKPSNERNSYYGKVSFYFPQKMKIENQYIADAIDFETVPSSINLSSLTNYSTFGIEFGRRGYIINPIDYGFSLYGGSTINISFNNIKSRVESYDKTLYEIYGATPQELNGKGSVFNLGFGLSGGMKYDIIGFGTLYFDVNFGYDFLRYPTNKIATTGYNTFGSMINFNVGIGYRKIIFSRNER